MADEAEKYLTSDFFPHRTKEGIDRKHAINDIIGLRGTVDTLTAENERLTVLLAAVLDVLEAVLDVTDEVVLACSVEAGDTLRAARALLSHTRNREVRDD